MPDVSPLPLTSSDSLQSREVLERPLPRLVPLPETPEEASESMMVGFLKPLLEFQAGGVQSLLLGKMFLFQDLGSNLPRVRRWMLEPLSHQGHKDICRKVFRAELGDVLKHVKDVLGDSSMT